MNGEREIGIINNGILSSYDEKLVPLFLKRTRNIEKWLRTRSADPSRSNIRKLKSVFDIEDDIDYVLMPRRLLTATGSDLMMKNMKI